MCYCTRCIYCSFQIWLNRSASFSFFPKLFLVLFVDQDAHGEVCHDEGDSPWDTTVRLVLSSAITITWVCKRWFHSWNVFYFMAETATDPFSLVIFWLEVALWHHYGQRVSVGYSFWESFCFPGKGTSLADLCLLPLLPPSPFVECRLNGRICCSSLAIMRWQAVGKKPRH